MAVSALGAAAATAVDLPASLLLVPCPSSNARARAPSSGFGASALGGSGFGGSAFGGAVLAAGDGLASARAVVASPRGAATDGALAGAGRAASLVVTPLLTRPTTAGAADAVRGGGNGSDGAPSLRGISIGMSTGIGRGCVSNNNGKPITPTPSSTAAPIRRRRARERAACTGSVVPARSLSEADDPCRNENRPMRCWSWAQAR